MIQDNLTVQIRRDVLGRAIEFLQQYDVQLQHSIYPDDRYKRDSIESVISEIEQAIHRGL